MSGWKIRPKDADEYDLPSLYAGRPTMCTLNFHHGGTTKVVDGRSFYTGKTTYVDFVDCTSFSLLELNPIMKQLGYTEDSIKSFEFNRPYCTKELGALDICSDEDINRMSRYVQGDCKVIDVIVEHNDNTPKSPLMTKKIARKSVQLSNKDIARRLFVHAQNESETEDSENMEGSESEDSQCDETLDKDNDEDLVDNENVIDDVEVDMTGYRLNLESQFQTLDNQVSQGGDEELEVIDNDYFDSGSDSGCDEIARKKARILRKLRKEKQALDEKTDLFYVSQTFGNSEEVKDLIRRCAVESRRSIKIVLNDKRRVRAVCQGMVPEFGPETQAVGPKKQPIGPKNKGKQQIGSCVQENPKNKGTMHCPWVLHCSKLPEQHTWMVKTYKSEHTCLQSREIVQCISKFLSKQIREQIIRNPDIPIRALQEELEQKLQISVSRMKAFRAKQQASTDNKGDYNSQYSILRDYCEELMHQNPGTTVKIDVEHPPNPNATTRQFKRIYICLGALKEGFKACMRELIGLDGAFMKGPFPGQVLTAVGVDSNNGIYPVAYAVVEAETRDSWTWFLQCLGPDLELQSNSNFTFITDRQKGLIQAISHVFPSAEHRFCVKHIHENMKLHWRGRYYKDILWRCATATSVPQFEASMEQMKRLNVEAYKWLLKIDPKHWTRSHFSGRCHSDMLLNNLCECLNKQLVGARDKPIIACVDFIREYLMKRIVVVQKVIDKSPGPLTPATTKLMQVMKREAADCKAIWNGGVKYQVSGPWGDQCVVDVQHMVCSCRKWELTGLPCKHAIATNWEMCKNQMQVGIPETWANRCYWLETWKKAYSYKVNPVTGTSTWPKSKCPLGMTAPIHHNQVGRPKKKRKRALYEDEPVAKDGKLSKRFYGVRCAKCGNRGHNSRTCKGQGGGSPNVGSEGCGSQVGVGGSQPGGSQGSEGGVSQGFESQGFGSQDFGSQGFGSQGVGSPSVGSEGGFGVSAVGVGGGSEGGSGVGFSEGGGTQPGGSSQVGQRRIGKKVLSKVRGRSHRILRSRLAKVTPGPGLTPEDAMDVE